MIFTDQVLYLHYPKTGGMMLTQQLLKKLRGNIYYTIPKGHASPKERLMQILGKVKILKGLRHENLDEANNIFRQYNLPHHLQSFDRIIVVIRNPYDYIVSRYYYLKDRQHHNQGGKAYILAAKGNFREFVLQLETYYNPQYFLENRLANSYPNMSVIKFEQMQHEMNDVLHPYLKAPISFSNVVNSSNHMNYKEYFEDHEMEEAVYKRFSFLFDRGFYNRLMR